MFQQIPIDSLEFLKSPPCEKCLRMGPELAEIGRSIQRFLQCFVMQENEAIDALFELRPDLEIILHDLSYGFKGFNINVPIILGGKLHWIKTVLNCECLNYETWKNAKQCLLTCVLCRFINESLAYKWVPGTFYRKRQYFCPMMIVPDSRRPHVQKKTNLIQYYNGSKIESFPELDKLRPYFNLNNLGNMAFRGIPSLFPKLILQKLLNGDLTDKKKNNLKEIRVQRWINVGSIENAVSNRGSFVVSQCSSDEPSAQRTLTDLRNRGYSSRSNRYKEVKSSNDYQALICPLECLKLITKNVTSHEYQTFGKSDICFFDPCFASDGKNIGSLLSLAMDVVISGWTTPADEILEVITSNSKDDDDYNCSIMIINLGKRIIRKAIHFDDETLIPLLKQKFELIEILRYDDVVFVNAVPFIPYKLSAKDNLFYTPNEFLILGRYLTEKIFGPVSLPVPLPQHNQGNKNGFVTNANKQVAQLYTSERAHYPSPTKTWSLLYPQTPFKGNTLFPLNVVWCTVCIMCVSGLNQEDGIVVKRSAIERGLFCKMRYGHYRIGFTGIVRFMKQVAPKDILTRNKILFEMCGSSSVHTYNPQLKISKQGESFVVTWDSDESFTLYDILQDTDQSFIYVITKDLIPLKIGDKLVAGSAQKGIHCGTVNDEDLPFVECKMFSGTPDLFLHPMSLKRETLSMFLEGANREVIAYDESRGVKFPYMDWSFERNPDTIKGLLQIGDELYTGQPINGKTGEYMDCDVTVLNMSYHILPDHGADEKIYSSSSCSRLDSLSGQSVKGRSHKGAMGISAMETEILIGHGVQSTLENLMFQRSDDKYEKVGKDSFVRVGTSSQRFLDDMRLLGLGMCLEIEPSVILS